MIRAPRLPPATVIDQRSLYTRADMIEFYRLGFADGRDSDDVESNPIKPSGCSVEELMDIFGMGSASISDRDLAKAFGKKL
jgi:hypothetical protein